MRAFILVLAAVLGLAALSPALAGKGPSGPEQTAQFVPGNPLEEALIKAATTPAERSRFTQLLLNSKVYLATPDMPKEPSSRVVPAGETLSVLSVALQDGSHVPAMFTSIDRIREAFGPDVGYIAMNGREALEMFGKGGVVLNPGSGYGVLWTGDEVAIMLGHPIERVIEKPTSIMLGTPAIRPVQLISYLENALGSDKRISEAWLALGQYPETGEFVWFLEIVSLSPHQDLMKHFEGLHGTKLLSDYPLEIVVVKPGEASRAGIRIKPRGDV